MHPTSRSPTLRLAAAALATTAFTALALDGAHAKTSPCAALTSTFPHGEALTLSSAIGYNGTTGPIVDTVIGTDVAAGVINATPASPAVCDVTLVLSSDGNPQDSQVQVGIFLPVGTVGTNDGSVWNGRFLGTGNGGFAGGIATSTLAVGLVPYFAVTGKTFVVANTDLGDGAGLGGTGANAWYNCNGLYCGSLAGNAMYGQKLGGLYGNPVAINDFGNAATHLMTLATKQLISDFYGTPATASYFHGCSTGGQQALMEAQRFPTDYNGILAGSPAYDRTHLHLAGAAYFEATHAYSDNSAMQTNAGLALAHAAVLKQCAGHDGGYSGDNYLTQPASCTWSATALQCTGATGEVPCTDPKATSCTCLVPHQVQTLDEAYAGAQDSNGNTLYPGYERGVEDPAAGLLIGEESVSEPLFDSLDYWAFGPTFTWQSLFASTTTPQPLLASRIHAADTTVEGTSTFAGELNADDANLGNNAFSKAGGKLIMYAGYEDPLIPAASSLAYFNRVRLDHARLGGTATTDFLRLYMAPGMWHCNGGPGANAFGNLAGQFAAVPSDPTYDILAVLIAWAEKGTKPGQIIATKYVNDNPSSGIAYQRPICPYPQASDYAHPLQPWQLPASWECQGRHEVFQGFSGGYGPQ